jgi:two-component system, cell cycle response regulator
MSSRILVVYHVPANVEVLVSILARGYDVISTAADGLEALAKIEAEKPDIVLLDVILPKLDGFEVCRRIRADPATAHILVVMVCAANLRVESLEAGADDFVALPISPLDELLQVIMRAEVARGLR